MGFRLDAAITATLVSAGLNLGLWWFQYRRQRGDAVADSRRDLLRREAEDLLRQVGEIIGGLQLMAAGQNPSPFLLGRRVQLRLAAGRLETLIGAADRDRLAAHLDAVCGDQRAKDRDQALSAARALQNVVHALLGS